MRYCTRRGNTNPARVASSKRSLFWMIVAIAAASSVLRGRATFATALGRFARARSCRLRRSCIEASSGSVGLDERDAAFMQRLGGLAHEALSWPHLNDQQRLLWATVLELDVVPLQELPPWFLERRNISRRHPGVDLLSLDGRLAVRCSNTALPYQEVKRFIRVARWIYKAENCTLVTSSLRLVDKRSRSWLQRSFAHLRSVTGTMMKRLVASRATSATGIRDDATLSDPPLRKCQQDCLEACAKGARKIEMACGTGKTRVMKELVGTVSGKVLITVPLRVLLDQFAVDFPGFCKVGMGHNEKIDFGANGFLAVTQSVHLLQKLKFHTILVDEAHHPLPKKLPKAKELFQFSATLEEAGINFQYTMGKAIEDGVLCDYDITVPAVTAHHAYVCLADLLLKQAGRFRRVLAYCNSVAEAKRFQMVLEELGLAAWHINAKTGLKERKRVMDEFAGILTKPVHVLVTVEVLGEGINIPNADTCMFVEPRNSYRSIIQAIGRILRHHPAKPLGHIILPAVAIPQKKLFHASVPGRSADLNQQRNNMTIASSSLVEPPHCERNANISLFETHKTVRKQQNRGTFEDSSDFNEKGAHTETMGNDVLMGPHQSQEQLTGCDQRKNSIPTHGGQTQHKQGSVTADSFEDPARQSEMLLESGAGGYSSRTNSWATFSCQTALSMTCKEVGCVEARNAENDKNGKSFRSLESEAQTDLKDMRTRYGKVGLQSFEGVDSSGQDYQNQLERFLAKLMQADERLEGASAGHRIQVIDCGMEVATEIGLNALTRAIFERLNTILSQTDPWESLLRSVEEFVRKHQRLPAQRAKDGVEASLGNWLSNQNIYFRSGRFPAHRLQKLRSSSAASIRQRVGKWLIGGREAVFEQRCLELRKYMQKHNQLPSRGSPDPEIRKLGIWLWNIRRGGTRSRAKEIKMLKAIDPLVRQLFEWDKHPLLINEARWSRQLEELSTFICQHGRLPLRNRASEPEDRVYRWLWLQRSRYSIGNLPEKFVAALREAHPWISEALRFPSLIH